MRNQSIREKITAARLYQYEVAQHIGVSEMTLIRWLRQELSPDKLRKIEQAIADLSREVGA